MVEYDCYNRNNENNNLLNTYHVIDLSYFLLSPNSSPKWAASRFYRRENWYPKRSSLLFKVTTRVKGQSQNSNAVCVAPEGMLFPVPHIITQTRNKENNNNNRKKGKNNNNIWIITIHMYEFSMQRDLNVTIQCLETFACLL